MMPPRERRPSPGAPSTGFASHQAAESECNSSAHCTDWAARRRAVAEWLPHAPREAIEVFAMRHFDRAESAAFLIAEQIERDRRIAERIASIEISQAFDWTRQSTVPSFAELQRRRSGVA